MMRISFGVYGGAIEFPINGQQIDKGSVLTRHSDQLVVRVAEERSININGKRTTTSRTSNHPS